jgi:hypothetical protein
MEDTRRLLVVYRRLVDILGGSLPQTSSHLETVNSLLVEAEHLMDGVEKEIRTGKIRSLLTTKGVAHAQVRCCNQLVGCISRYLNGLGDLEKENHLEAEDTLLQAFHPNTLIMAFGMAMYAFSLAVGIKDPSKIGKGEDW